MTAITHGERFKLSDYSGSRGIGMAHVRTAQLVREQGVAALAAKLDATLAKVADAGPDGYVLGAPSELDALTALRRMGLVFRAIEETTEVGVGGIELSRWRYLLTDAGKAKLDGTLVKPEPRLDAEEASEAMLAKRAELAEGR